MLNSDGVMHIQRLCCCENFAYCSVAQTVFTFVIFTSVTATWNEEDCSHYRQNNSTGSV